MKTRQESLTNIQDTPDIDVLIIGAGINGIGVFRELALQGLRVLIIDRADFCSGASAASSHMVHGGIRYLENGEFRLVREAVAERNRLIENAPQYVKPLATTVPVFKWLSGILNAPLKFLNWLDRPSERGAIVIKLGLMMYDSFTRNQGTVPTHDFHMRDASLSRFPDLNPDILCTATYYDAAMPSPERIAIEVLLDGENADPNQAVALNYISAISAVDDEVALRDEISGDEFTVKPKLVINAAGPWIDFANEAIGIKSNMIGGTKGSHIVLDNPQLFAATKGNEFFFENQDGRIVLIYPLVNRVLVGTSDLAIDNPDNARCTDDEIDYFLNFINIVFPNIEVNHSQIVYRFSGVRPLPTSEANTTGQISRDHSNKILEATAGRHFPIFNLIGGKWTTFRAFSESVANTALERLKVERRASTHNLPIGGGVNYPQNEGALQNWINKVARETGLHTERIEQLFDRYGTKAKAISKFISQGKDRQLAYHPTYSTREVAYITIVEKVVHLDDFLKRRSLLAMLGQISFELVHELSHIIADTLSWSEEMRRIEVERTLDLLADHHSVTLRPHEQLREPA